jgi:hypothetical protein
MKMQVRVSTGGAALALAVLLSIQATAPAAADPAECQAVTDALLANAKTPYHSTTSMTFEYTAPVAEAQRKMAMPHSQDTETIFTGAALFVKLPTGKWVDTHATSDAMQEQVRRSVAKIGGCEHLADEQIDGEKTSVYVGHSSDDKHVVTMKIWIAADRGLPLRTDADVGALQAGQVVMHEHVSTHTTYGDQQAPAIE